MSAESIEVQRGLNHRKYPLGGGVDRKWPVKHEINVTNGWVLWITPRTSCMSVLYGGRCTIEGNIDENRDIFACFVIVHTLRIAPW